MSILEAIQQSSNMEILKNNLKSLIKDYDNSVEYYKHELRENNLYNTDFDSDTDNIIDSVESVDKVKNALKNIITSLNKIQVVFEKIGYSDSTGTTDDCGEESYLQQLDKFSEQGLKLIENFEREYFVSFSNQLYYLTSLSEIHYNNKFGDLTEEIKVTPAAEEMLEETEEYLGSLPEIKTNEIK